MKHKTFSSFRPDNTVVQLIELLNVIPDNKLVWTILDFDGMGIDKVPGGLSLDEFYEAFRTQPHGFLMSWTELKDFARPLEQTFDCLIIGALHVEIIERNVIYEKVDERDYSIGEIFLECFDSTEWSVWATGRSHSKCITVKMAVAV